MLWVLVTGQIIDPPSLGVLEKLIGIDYLLELLLSPRILLVAVGMVLFGAFLEACLDLLLVGAPRDAEHLVGIWYSGLYGGEE